MTFESKKIRCSALGQAVWHQYLDEETGQMLPGIGAARIVRFSRRSRLDKLVVSRLMYAGTPHDISHIRVSAWERNEARWRVVFERDDLRRLSEAPFQNVLDLGGVQARVMQVQCLCYHPGPPDPGEQWSNPRNPPFAILDDLDWFGEYLEPHFCDLPVAPRLSVEGLAAAPPGGMTLRPESDRVGYFSDTFATTFSLRRPLLLHLGWDSARAGKAARNLAFAKVSQPFLFNGPLLSTPDWDCGARLWGGNVSVEKNVVRYTDLHADSRLSVDATFEVRPDGMDVHLSQTVREPIDVIHAEAWRFVWNGIAATTATLGIPSQEDGPTGIVNGSVIWAAPGFGNLACAVSGAAHFQVDSWRAVEALWAGLSLNDPPGQDLTSRLQPSQKSASLQLRVVDIGPRGTNPTSLHPEIRRNWAPGLMFRPELAGFSNNAMSTNCHLSQTGVTDLAAHTREAAGGLPIIELARYTATMALKRGRGYGDCREIYQDSDPSILNAAGRVHQVSPDTKWLADVWPYVRIASERILSKVDDYGLVVAPATGNSGEGFEVTNAWDSVKFGHYDAYSNVETYRAFNNVAALARDAGEPEFEVRIRRAAAKMKVSYADCFYDPETGWLGSWRSADGQLHNYGHTCVNAPACLYGLVEREQAREILSRMEKARLELGWDNFRNGIPSTLAPIERLDYIVTTFGGTPLRDDGLDTFGIYCNGCQTLGLANYYVRAMKVFGFDDVAEQMATEILEGHELGRLVDGLGAGIEFYTPEGLTCGYEGAYVLQFAALLAIAQNRGQAPILDPEFWPA